MINKTILYILIAFLIPCTITNCCDSKLLAEYSFTTDDLKINPYTGTETLKYISNHGQTWTFSSGTRGSVTQTFYKNANNYDEKCKGDYTHAECNVTSFTSMDDTIQFNIWLKFDLPNSVVRKAILFISQNPPMAQSDRDAYFDNDTIYNQGPSHSDSSYTYYKSINIGNKIFNNVYEIHVMRSTFSIITKFYYSQKNGIVGFDTQNQGIWYLDKIIK